MEPNPAAGPLECPRMAVGESRYRIFETPAGAFTLIADPAGALSASWDDVPAPNGAVRDQNLMPQLSKQLEHYFLGEPVEFENVATPPGPAFHHHCWALCRAIPRGETRSYGELAKLAGSSTGAARAVGQAMRRNPLPVIVPCHRVVAAGGRLYGYSGSVDPAGRELGIKRSLLGLERATPR